MLEASAIEAAHSPTTDQSAVSRRQEISNSYTTSQTFLNSESLKKSSAHQTCIYLIQSTAKQYNSETVLLFKITVLYLNMF